jgi:hypothetical protein
MAWIIVVLFVLMGPTPLVLGTVWTWREWREHREQVHEEQQRERAGWVPIVAVVVRCSTMSRDARTGNWTYVEEFEWTDADGRPHHGSFRLGSHCSTGRRFSILHNPHNPEEYMHPVGGYLPLPLILCVMGFAFMYIGVKHWLKKRRAPQSPAPTSPYR